MSATIRELLALGDRADIEALLGYVLDKPRSFFYTYPEHVLTKVENDRFQALLSRRLNGEPVAYLTGKKAFWTFSLDVTPNVLIPRADTECLVNWVLETFDDSELSVIDLGTGSGAIACALASERPSWQVVATDQCELALDVAMSNAQRLGVSIAFEQSDWLEEIDDSFDLIVSNPPYIDRADPDIESDVKQFEPNHALFSDEEGLADIQTIAKQAKYQLIPGGHIVLEHGFKQADDVCHILSRLGYQEIFSHADHSGLDRFVVGKWI